MSKYDTNTLDISNPAPRCPVVLLLDTSGSMAGAPIDELNRALRQFIRETSEDEAASMSVELEIITFADSARVHTPFKPILEVPKEPAALVANGMTHMGQALSIAKRDIEARRKLYSRSGVSSYRPWVILMTDGGPNDDWVEPAREMKTLGEQGKIQYIGLEIGPRTDHDVLCRILPAEPGPVRLKGLRFKQFFKWLTDSLRSVSASTVAQQDDVSLPPIGGWADLASLGQ